MHHSTTCWCSSWLSVGLSPVVPTGTRPLVPSAICHSTRPRNASSSTEPFLKGVTRAVNDPRKLVLAAMHTLLEGWESCARSRGPSRVLIAIPARSIKALASRDSVSRLCRTIATITSLGFHLTLCKPRVVGKLSGLGGTLDPSMRCGNRRCAIYAAASVVAHSACGARGGRAETTKHGTLTSRLRPPVARHVPFAAAAAAAPAARQSHAPRLRRRPLRLAPPRR